MSVTIDRLEIEVETSANEASKGIDNLISSLRVLKNICTGGAGLNEVAHGLHDLNAELKRFNESRANKAFKAMSKGADEAKQKVYELVKATEVFRGTVEGMGTHATKPRSPIAGLLGDGREKIIDGEGWEVLDNLPVVFTDAKNASDGLTNALEDTDKELKRKPKDAKGASDAFDELLKSAKGASIGLKYFLSSLKRIIMYRGIYALMKTIENGLQEGVSNAYQFAQIMGNNVAKSMDVISEHSFRMKNQIGALATQLLTTIAPTLIKISDTIFNITNKVTEILASFNGQSTYMQANLIKKPWEEAKEAVEDYKKQLLGLDELNVISNGNDKVTNPWEDYENMFTEVKVSAGVSKVVQTVKQQLDELKGIVAGSLVGIGLLLTFTGANVPLGLGLLASGTYLGIKAITEDWDGFGATLSEKLATIEGIAGGALLGLGAVLTLTGANMGLGLGMMVAGASSIGASALSANWDKLPTEVQNAVSLVTASASSALLALGSVIALSGANIPLGIGLMASGAVGLATIATLNWDKVKTKVKKSLDKIALAVGSASLAIGSILAFSGVNLPLGIGLMVAGAGSLGVAVTLNWSKIKTKISKQADKINAVLTGVGIGGLALGALLAFSGANIPLGIGLMLGSGAIIGTEIALNWDSILEGIKSTWSKIESFWNDTILAGIKKGVGTVEEWLNWDINGDGIVGIATPQGSTLNTSSSGSTHSGSSGSFSTGTINTGSSRVNSSTSIMYGSGYYSLEEILKRNGITIKANGGYVGGGHLFFANENGNPEYIGNMGGTTAVANSGQMAEAIEGASYRGMARALQQYGNQNGNNGYEPMSGDEVFVFLRKKAESYSQRTGTPAFN